MEPVIETKKKRVKAGGRVKGTPNKATKELKEAILAAFEMAGGVDYLVRLSVSHPQIFATLIGKVLPHTVKVSGGGPNGEFETITRIERVIVRPGDVVSGVIEGEYVDK